MLKRAFDFILSAVGILILSPVYVLLAILILLDSKGGIFYMQQRVGKNNLDFYIYKFRTMHQGAEKKGLLTVGAKDSRITRVGYFLRKYKLDELPQLLNVLKGDMSFVGPRPEVRRYVALYTPRQMQVLSVKPGITDYASIAYSNESELLKEASDPEKFYIETVFPAKLELNLKYIAEKSFWKDLQLIFLTLKKILS
ncbi:MAG TPA: sugar transferase [Bacteroidia bacterium]|nr:sugar transferase [Bacteroidia bacterium]HRH09386.1 sugar transferase [Bacteroidia bacterium]HRH63718.1 sugar transferase [Bacteroidia bacterium]